MASRIREKLHKKGDVAIVSFPFTDLSGAKRRPVLVVGASDDHIIVVFITTRRTGPRRWHVPVAASEASGLVTPSIIRCDKILSIDTDIMPGGIGKMPREVMQKVDGKLRKLLHL